MDSVREERVVRPDGRVVAWTEHGTPEGLPLLRLPGTPGSRYSFPADRRPWAERGLRVIIVERPGFGASTRLPGRGFAEHADDLAAVLDHVGIDRVPAYGGSGAAPHLLGFAARHPDRFSAGTVVDGAAPMTEEEVRGEIEANAIGDLLARSGATDALRDLLTRARDEVLADPVDGFRALMTDAPAADQEVMAEHAWQVGFMRGLVEALTLGVDGWMDEVLAINGDWGDIDLDAVTGSVTWWHSLGDRNCPISAARRLVARLPRARFVTWDGAGHLAGAAHEAEILDELLARAGSSSATRDGIPTGRASGAPARTRPGSAIAAR